MLSPAVPSAPNPVPVTVTESPTCPEGTEKPVMVGAALGARRVRVLAVDAPPPCAEVTVTPTGPVLAEAGTTAVSEVLLTRVTAGDFTPPMMTDGRPEVPKPVPVRVTVEPPLFATLAGEIEVMTGRAA